VQLRELGLASAFTLLTGLYIVGVVNIVLFGVLASLAIAVTRYCTRRLGGVTGDTLGAVGELVETAAFCLFAALASGGSRH
jgi:adenosylcobinamide-GDP ribazoletransferase